MINKGEIHMRCKMAVMEKKGRFLQKPFWSDLKEHHHDHTWNRPGNAENLLVYAEYHEEAVKFKCDLETDCHRLSDSDSARKESDLSKFRT
jgi:hypothetical protein